MNPIEIGARDERFYMQDSQKTFFLITNFIAQLNQPDSIDRFYRNDRV